MTYKVALLLLCLAVSGYLVQLIKSFGYMSISELKRRARGGDAAASRVFKARVHGLQVWIVLWGLLSLNLAVIVLLLDEFLPIWLALVLDVVLLVMMHVILPWARWPKPSLRLASQVGPVLGNLLYKTNPAFRYLDRLLGSWVEIEATQRIHSKDELLENLQRLPGQLDSVGKDELRIATHALTFGEKQIHQVMTPRSVLKTVKRDELLSPVVLGELHDSGFSRIPVWEGQDSNIVGILYLKDALTYKTTKTAGDMMKPDVYYVNEQTNLDQVLNAFLRTQHHLFIVVNEYEEIVGVVSIEDVLEQIIGKSIVDEFDKYEDLRAVAKQRADQLAAVRTNPDEPERPKLKKKRKQSNDQQKPQ